MGSAVSFAKAMSVHAIDPLTDGRWDRLVEGHAQATAFHEKAWLQALARTYGFRPMALTTASPGQPLADGVAFCHVSSWLTGSRMVSLPFADHCQPLLDHPEQLALFADWLRSECDRRRSKYVELRPLSSIQGIGGDMQATGSYCFHSLDLTPGVERLFRGLHKDSMQRRIRRAEHGGLSYEVGCSRPFVDDFYRLLVITRRRHHLLPQPRKWFHNLAECFAERAQIRLAKKNGVAVGAIFTLRHGSTVIYKYGCSDGKFHSLGIMPFLFWRLIEESKISGAEKIDFGRSDLDHQSLITFKDKFGAQRESITYYRYTRPEGDKAPLFNFSAVYRYLSILPNSALSLAGGLLYRHLG